MSLISLMPYLHILRAYDAYDKMGIQRQVIFSFQNTKADQKVPSVLRLKRGEVIRIKI